MGVASTRAQHGEDLLLAERFGHKRSGVYVEVGALDGDRLSNTYYFEHELGWSGLLVEADPTQAQLCARNRPGSTVANKAAVAPGAPATVQLQVAEGNAEFSTISANRIYAGMLSERGITTTAVDVPTATLDDMLVDAGLGAIDFVTVDVEGHEREVFQGFDLARWRPTVVLVECASGAPSPAIAIRLFRAGYARTRRIVVNDWYEQVPVAARTGRFVLAYVTAVPGLLRLGIRETLRALGILERVRRWRGIGGTGT